MLQAAECVFAAGGAASQLEWPGIGEMLSYKLVLNVFICLERLV